MLLTDHYTALESQFGRPVLGFAGSTQAPVLGIAMMPDEGEGLQFTGPVTRGIKAAMVNLGVSAQMVGLTYCVKRHEPGLSEDRKLEWRSALLEEIKLLDPLVIIIFGVEVANLLFLTTYEDVEQLRCTQIASLQFREISFFVTHDARTVYNNKGFDSDVGRAWLEDLDAVFCTRRTHFAKELIME